MIAARGGSRAAARSAPACLRPVHTDRARSRPQRPPLAQGRYRPGPVLVPVGLARSKATRGRARELSCPGPRSANLGGAASARDQIEPGIGGDERFGQQDVRRKGVAPLTLPSSQNRTTLIRPTVVPERQPNLKLDMERHTTQPPIRHHQRLHPTKLFRSSRPWPSGRVYQKSRGSMSAPRGDSAGAIVAFPTSQAVTTLLTSTTTKNKNDGRQRRESRGSARHSSLPLCPVPCELFRGSRRRERSEAGRTGRQGGYSAGGEGAGSTRRRSADATNCRRRDRCS
jgi:hypothetical protein